ncbi:twin-arginine translocase TatA/TatE family subunit [PVC group bacterium]|nr:twin-arginine translocase TatA/TatE family subunit [PVC group bacterium]
MICQPLLGFLPGTPGALELLAVFALVLLLFGPKKLPEIARKIGKALRDLRHASDDFKDQVMKIEDDSLSKDNGASPSDCEKKDNTDEHFSSGKNQIDLNDVVEAEEGRNG